MLETEADNTIREMTVDGDVGDYCVEPVETLPDKSRSLRRSSVQKKTKKEKARCQTTKSEGEDIKEIQT